MIVKKFDDDKLRILEMTKNKVLNKKNKKYLLKKNLKKKKIKKNLISNIKKKKSYF